MAYKSCVDCGTKLQSGFCPNCDEETFIADQYLEQGMRLPEESTEFMQKLKEQKPRP